MDENMSCMLRIAGKNLNIDKLLSKTNFVPQAFYRKGEAKFKKTQPKGEKNKRSGASFRVSTANYDQFEKQKREAITFLKTNRREIRRIMKWPGVDEGELDFGIHSRDVIIRCDYLPPELIKLAGSLGLGIEISQYPPSTVFPKSGDKRKSKR